MRLRANSQNYQQNICLTGPLFLTVILILYSVLPIIYCSDSSNSSLNDSSVRNSNSLNDSTDDNLGFAALSLNASHYEWNMAIGLMEVYGFVFLCGGVLSSANIVIASASCFVKDDSRELDELRWTKFRIQDKNKEFHRLRSITLHPNFTVGYNYNDIAVLKLKYPLLENLTVAPLVRKIDFPRFLFHDDEELITDWDLKLSELTVSKPISPTLSIHRIILESVAQLELTPSMKIGSVIKDEDCEAEYDQYFTMQSLNYSKTFPKGIDSSLMCIRLRSVPNCEQNRGYQVVTTAIDQNAVLNYFVIGTRTQGIEASSNSFDCKFMNLPAIYTNVISFMKWINSVS